MIDTPAGTLSLEVPETAGTDEPFYPQALERGRRSCRAVMLAVAEMYVCGVSTRDALRVLAQFGLKSLSSTQVSRAAKLLDDELEAWRGRTLGEVRYLFLDARYEKSRQGGVVRDAAVLSAIEGQEAFDPICVPRSQRLARLKTRWMAGSRRLASPHRSSAGDRSDLQSRRGQQANHPIGVPSMFDSLAVEVLYPA